MTQQLYKLFIINTRICIIEIGNNLSRSFISCFGILLGVASLLIILSFIHALEKQVTDSVITMGGIDIVTIESLEPETHEDSLSFLKSPGLKLSQIVALKESIPAIDRVYPDIEVGRREVSSGGKASGARLRAVSADYFKQFGYAVSKGSFFTDLQQDKSARVCLIGQRVADRLFPRGSALNKELNMDGYIYTIIGEIATENRWDRRAREIIMPYTTWQHTVGGVQSVLPSVKVRVRDVTELATVQSAIERSLLEAHRGVVDFEVVLNEEKIKEMESSGKALDILLIVIALLILFSGGIGIMNIMFAVIGDRIREIGLRKALGARRSDIFMQFIIESIALCFIGGVPGLLLGSVATFLPKDFLPMDPYLTPIDYGIAISFVFIVGITAGVFPAWKAANMKPVEALQYV